MLVSNQEGEDKFIPELHVGGKDIHTGTVKAIKEIHFL